MVSNIDIVPTVVDLCDIEVAGDYPMDGKSILPILNGEDRAIHKSLFLEIGATRAVIMDGWKYLAFRTPEEKQKKYDAINKVATHINDTPGGRGSESPAIAKYPHYYDSDQLYNIIEDPDEQNNLYGKAEHKKKINKLKKELKSYLNELPEGFGEFKK